MVNRIPGSKRYGSTSSAVNRSRTPSAIGASLKGSQSTHSTVSTRTISTDTYGRNGSRDIVTSADNGTENNSKSTGSVSSDSTRSGNRKMNRSSFRRTLMFQKNKRNGSNNASNSNSDSDTINETKRGAKTTTSNSECLSPSAVANRLSKDRPAPIFKTNRKSLRSHVRARRFQSTVEEREAGADSPIFVQPKATIVSPQSSKEQLIEKEDIKQREEIPRGHVNTILRFYGSDNNSPGSLDLYRDVLRVSPKASDREVRIAYFRRGREILGDNANRTKQNHAAAKAQATKLDPITKARFQAVSMAYEILSTPTWKATYLKQGGLSRIDHETPQYNVATTGTVPERTLESSENDPFPTSLSKVEAVFPQNNDRNEKVLQKRDSAIIPAIAKENTEATEGKQKQIQRLPGLPTALRKSSFTGPAKANNSSPSITNLRIQRSSSSVRWKDHVEELVFAKHPNEHASDTDSYTDSDSDDSDSNSDTPIADNDIPKEVRSKNIHQRGPRLIGNMSGNTSLNSSAGDGSRNTQDVSTNDSYRSIVSDSSGTRRRKKSKPKIIIDSEELESHLQRMDDEAEKHFVQDFWDNFEESMDGILSMVDSIGGGGETSNGTTQKNKNSTSFSSASSWLSQTASWNSFRGKVDRAAQDAIIGRSLSHDITMPSKNIDDDDADIERVFKRSNSFPLPSLSASRLDMASPRSPSQNSNRIGSATGSVGTTDQELSTPAKIAPDERVTSPFEMIINSWPFQSEENNREDSQQQTVSSTLTPPAIVSPSPTSKTDKTSVKLPRPTDLNTTVSAASSILSTTQRRQKLFRPISPALSEASEVVTSDSVPVPSPSRSKHTDESSNMNSNAESDQFELESRLSEMDSVDLSKLENPFRGVSSTPASTRSESKQRPSPNDVFSKAPNGSNNSAIMGQKTKKMNRFKVSLISKIKGSSTEKDVSSSRHTVQTDKISVRTSNSKSDQSLEDVFAGVEEDSEPIQQYDLEEGDEMNVKDISIERAASHMSDLSGSVFSSRRQIDDGGKAVTYEFASVHPSTTEYPQVACDPSLSTSVSSATSLTTKKSLLNSTAGRSQGSATYSSYASSTQRNANSHFLDSPGVEASGFFEYFIAYVTAVMTECATLGATAGVAEYHKDFLGLFSNDNNQVGEVRE